MFMAHVKDTSGTVHKIPCEGETANAAAEWLIEQNGMVNNELDLVIISQGHVVSIVIEEIY